MACDSPEPIKNKKRRSDEDYAVLLAPCGKCNSCLKSKTRQWYVRLKYELRSATSAYFVTLTYDDLHIPISFNGIPTLDPEHVRNFFKLMRYYDKIQKPGSKKRYTNKKISYYLSSEYGTLSHRPHYHAILFNVNDTKAIYKAWKHGTVQIAKISDQRINYVIGYIDKKIGIPQTDYDDRKPEFARISHGMGISFMEKAFKFNLNNEEGYTKLEGLTYVLPRYYKNKIWPQYKVRNIAKDGTVIERLYTHPTAKRIGKKNLHLMLKKTNEKLALVGQEAYDKIVSEDIKFRNDRNFRDHSLKSKL